MLNIVITSLLVSYLLTPLSRKVAFLIQAVDYPNGRRVNKQPIPNLGGLAIYGGLLAGIFVSGQLRELNSIILAATLVVVLGIIDDLYEISPLYKLLGQILISLVVIQGGIRISYIRGYPLGWLSLPLTLCWLLGTTNVINLIDGLDGLAGAVTIIAATTLGIFAYQQGSFLITVLILALLGAVVGFLRYNLNPAQIFMGDTGSMLLGFILGVSAIGGVLKSLTVVSFFIPLLVLGVPIGDTLAAIIRRSRARKSIFEADDSHLHHQLLNLGLTQNQVVAVICLASSFLSFIALGLSQATLAQTIFLLVGAINLAGLGIYELKLKSAI